MVTARRLHWAGPGRWSEEVGPAPEAALVVDSFLAVGGRVRDLDRHGTRFRAGCAALGLPTADLGAFLTDAEAALPRAGRWFPRVEAHPDTRLVLWIRPAPPEQRETRLWVAPEPDARRRPEVKGPDLALLAGLRGRAVSHGADDALLTGPDGVVREAAHSALLWWRGDRLCVPASDLPVLPSVTAARLRGAARAAGVPITPERCAPAGLAEAEVWTVNALHGIRPVVGWRGAGAPVRAAVPDAARLDHFRSQLAADASTRR